jgi:acyl-CoA dehydrogenase
MAVRTGGPGAAGLSVMVVPLKGYPGVTMRRLKVSGQITGGTTYIELDDVKVPVGNLIGREGDGMRIIMTNFNHERLTIAVGVTRQARVALAAAFQYTMKREAFGKTLIDQPVVRHRLAKAGAELETMWAWVEQILYQLCHLSKEEADQQLGGITALAKAKAAMVLNECAQCAVLLFGGAGYTASGQGELVEGRFLAFVVPGSRLTCDSDSARCPWSSHTRWIRGRPSGSGRATTGQDLSSWGEETRPKCKDVMAGCSNPNEIHFTISWPVIINFAVLLNSMRIEYANGT